MEMEVDALELLQTTAQQAAAPQKIDLPLADREARLAIAGRTEVVILPPPNRQHTVRTLIDLGRMTIAMAEGKAPTRFGDAESPTPHPVVYHDEERCVLVCDDADRRDFVTLELVVTPEWSAICKLFREKPTLSQREAIQLLRLVFNVDAEKIRPFRQMEAVTKEASKAAINRGKESLGNSIEAEVIGAADIPETLTIAVPIYRNAGEDERYDVPCAVELDVQNGKVQIVPEPGRIEEIMHRHQATIAARLEEAFAERSIPVYYGKP